MSHGSSVGIVTRLQDARQRDRSSIPGKVKKLHCFPQHRNPPSCTEGAGASPRIDLIGLALTIWNLVQELLSSCLSSETGYPNSDTSFSSSVSEVKCWDSSSGWAEQLSRQCGILNISYPYRPPRPVTRKVLPFFCFPLFYNMHLALGFTQPLTEMSTWNLSRGECHPANALRPKTHRHPSTLF
jgi:hypothetical protein